ncbi:MAG: hypothetical protein HN416_12755 [Nitrospina sp.]|nr:hypothetical protein [Nitrospina sp.]
MPEFHAPLEIRPVRYPSEALLESAYHYYLYDLSEKLVPTGKTDSAVSLLEFAVESGEGTREIRELLDSLLIGD